MAEGMGNETPPIIRIVKKSRPAPHHGGAWKVAYADFVTALMAFFLVMWIVGLSKPVREAVEAYFKDPVGFSQAVHDGQSPFSAGDATGILSGGAAPGTSSTGAALRAKEERLNEVQKGILKELDKSADLKALRESVKVHLTKEGLRVELMEKTSSLFFDSGSAALRPRARHLLRVIAQQLRKLDNPVVIEGHTDGRPLRNRPNYTNWELSADRANAARRAMEQSGLRRGRILAVHGYADRKPLRPDNPLHYSNRRVSILVARAPDGP